MRDEITIKCDEVCAVCGARLPTESGRVICKDCELKDNADYPHIILLKIRRAENG